MKIPLNLTVTQKRAKTIEGLHRGVLIYTDRKLSPHLVPRRQTEKSSEQWVKVLPAIGVS